MYAKRLCQLVSSMNSFTRSSYLRCIINGKMIDKKDLFPHHVLLKTRYVNDWQLVYKGMEKKESCKFYCWNFEKDQNKN